MKVNSFKQLIVWQRAMELTEEIYRRTAELPSAELYGLSSQMRRAAISIPSNIAEGKKQGTLKHYIHFLQVADGSGAELETQILLAQNLYPKISFIRCISMLEEVQKMLATMRRKLDTSKT